MGASAREALVAAAATQLGVPAIELTAADRFITHKASGRTVSFGAVAADAAKLPLPVKPRLKEVEELRYLGCPVVADSVAKVFWAIERATLIRRRHRP